jgi:diphthamide biosynthesis protein 4
MIEIPLQRPPNVVQDLFWSVVMKASHTGKKLFERKSEVVGSGIFHPRVIKSCVKRHISLSSYQGVREVPDHSLERMNGITKKSYYELLGVSAAATYQQIKEAYREKLLNTHPDKTNQIVNDNIIVELKNAYNTLSNDSTRKLYDEQLHQTFKKGGLLSSGEGLDIFSLDDFDCVETDRNILFKKDCHRCTTQEGYVLSESDLEKNGTDDGMGGYEIIVQCIACSLWLKVKYYDTEDE